MTRGPLYSLRVVQEVCRSGDLNRIWFSAPSRSLTKVIEVYQRTNAPKDRSGAAEFMINCLLNLKPNHFVGRVSQWSGLVVADVYGAIFDERPWYIKFVLGEDGVVEQISFHPPEYDMVTVSGLKIPKGWGTNED